MAQRSESLPEALSRAGIDFVLVGATAGIIRGAPFTTFDVDIVHSRAPENLDRLHAFLVSVGAHYRGRPKSQRLQPTREHLDTAGRVLLRTELGPLDILGAIEGGANYAALVSQSERILVYGVSILVPTLDALIALKRQGTRPEDPLKLAQLEAVRRS